MQSLDPMDLMRELEPTVEANLNRHLSVAQEWMPHEYVPWRLGRDFTGDDGLAWSPDQSPLAPAAQTAFEVNLLTEDNLPSYHHEIATVFGRDGAWGTWVHRWTAEEGRHACCIRDYLLVTRAVDPIALERDRMATMEVGYNAEGKGLVRVLAYVSFQELATRIAHRNTGRMCGEPIADRLMARISADENLHMVFYRDLVRAALDVDPDQTVVAIAAEVLGFQMPGTGIKNFARKSVQIAKAGIYDLRIHRDEVLAPVLRHWKVFDMTFASAAAQQAQAELATHLEQLEALATQYEERQALTRERIAATQSVG
ncbi:MAG TPA: acyl-ACP desaturase [Mycobacteriales bacterium]|jgi:acyl-[acyl-carrier-protein] desaturase|nr:acyl-ACP desaturase [Mycobacteriales bacterium]